VKTRLDAAARGENYRSAFTQTRSEILPKWRLCWRCVSRRQFVENFWWISTTRKEVCLRKG